MLLTAGLCVLTSAILVSAGIFLLLRSRHLARQKLKEFTQSADSEATRDYQVSKTKSISKAPYIWNKIVAH
jgi:hypothetical protein